MVTYNEYLKSILDQIIRISYNLTSNVTDKPGDLDIIKKELLKLMDLQR